MQVLKWQRESLRALNSTFSALSADTRTVYKSGTGKFILDASQYEFWYDGDVKFHYEDNISRQSMFAKWADGFRAEVSALKLR